jgi:hypothetical protein
MIAVPEKVPSNGTGAHGRALALAAAKQPRITVDNSIARI